MWLAATLIVVALTATAVVIIGWKPRATPSQPVWDISGVGGTYTGIVGTLGGFAVTSAIFVAGLDGARESAAFAVVIGMLFIAFLILVFSALMYASTPSAPANDDGVNQSLSHALANLCGCLGLTVSWLALIPLLDVMMLPALAQAFNWFLLTTTIAAIGWVALFTYHLTLANLAACLALPVVGLALPALYRLTSARVWPSIWPATDPALHFAFLALATAGLMLGLHMGVLVLHGSAPRRGRLQSIAHRLVLAVSAMYALVVGFTWFAVAAP